MISILRYSFCDLAAGLSPSFSMGQGHGWRGMLIPCAIAILFVPICLATTDRTWFLACFLLFICFVG